MKGEVSDSGPDIMSLLFYFPQKISFDLSFSGLQRRQFACKVKVYFLGMGWGGVGGRKKHLQFVIS